MSLLSQFYPGGSASGFINAEVLVVAGGGGGGGGGSAVIGNEGAGGGGAGGLYYGYIALAPGSTNPITVGGGGGGGAVPYRQGSKGSPSKFTSSTQTINVIGGGYGGGYNGSSSTPTISGGPGGSGGGAYGIQGNGYGFGGLSSYSAPQGERWRSLQSIDNGSTGSLVAAGGRFFGTPGSSSQGTPVNYSGSGGGATGLSLGFDTEISGFLETYSVGTFGKSPAPATANTGNGGNAGVTNVTPSAGSTGANGGSGVVIVKYPTQFAAAPSYPGGADISSFTPGFRTYKFTSPGSITLP